MTSATDHELCFLSIDEMCRGYARRTFSPVEVTEAFLRRIETFDPVLRTYITVTADVARAAARASEQRHSAGRAIGPLDGVPVGVKDLIDTRGIPTTSNSRQHAERVPDADATVIRRMREAGAVLLGKHDLWEFAMGPPALDALHPPARNPWNTDLIPGGSSSGTAAAIAAGLCAAGLGSDTGGSVRSPASYCGVVSLKPSHGRVSCRGVRPLSPSLDDVGPMARSVRDAALLLGVVEDADMVGPDGISAETAGDPGRLENSVAGSRIAAPLADVEEASDVHPETMAAYRDALAAFERLGATVEVVSLPGRRQVNIVHRVVMLAEAVSVHLDDLRRRPEGFGETFHSRILEGALFTATDHVDARRGRTAIVRAFDRLMREYDLIVLPTTPHPAWTLEEERNAPSWSRNSFTRVFNVTGQPAITIPCGYSSDGLPIGVQIAGPRGQDTRVLAAAFAYEREHSWSSRHPTLTASASTA